MPSVSDFLQTCCAEMSIIAGALTVEGYLNTNTTGTKTGIVVDGTEISIPVPSDWNATSGEAQVLNKPTNLSQFANDLIGVPGNFNVPGNLYIGGSAAASGTIQVPSDWNETDNTKADYIKNKPTNLSQFTNDLSAVVGNFTVPGNLIVEGNANVTTGSGSSSGTTEADWNSTSGPSQILNKPQLAPVATGGAIPKQVPWQNLTLQSGTAQVANQQPAQYCIDELGYVRLRGYITTPGTLGQPIFTLPSAALPVYAQYFGPNQCFQLATTGNVSQTISTPGSNYFFSFQYEPLV